jgi:hypothetical protein
VRKPLSNEIYPLDKVSVIESPASAWFIVKSY